ncbi:hypothetical protein [Leptospira ilyithenensis]|uniref:Uncharacterized protein n=1 Tax=Leptospira ilyithenensis TaxID=2484901 RepID=A0A4V3JXC1_9LEPT|nr:hypothetical protein [Leptospira ilyithenensis]TGN10987.1 hypothetical protein EHS11_07385 [Leptospira ilyithenensis]
MDIASGVARVSGLGEPLTYVMPTYNTKAIEKVDAVQSRDYKPKYPSEDTASQASSIQGDSGKKASYTPGDLVNVYA